MPEAKAELRPGERLVAGEAYIYDLDLLNAYLAELALLQAPADLTILSWSELSNLHICHLMRQRRWQVDDEIADIGRRVCEERATRPEYINAYGGSTDAR